MRFNRNQYDAAMAEVYRITSANPDRLFLLRLCPEWHRMACWEHLIVTGFDLDRIADGPIRLGVGNVQISQARINMTHELTAVEGAIK